MEGAVRDRVREKMRAELAGAMYPLFAKHGLQHVTAEQAARAAGISRATFFRYFSSKEDAVVTASRSLGAQFAAEVEGLESLPGESLLELLRRGFEPSVIAAEREPVLLREQVRLIWRTPSLRASWWGFRQDQLEELAAALAPFCAHSRLARTAAVTALTLYDHALGRWLESEHQSLREILDEAFDHVAMLDENWSVSRQAPAS